MFNIIAYLHLRISQIYNCLSRKLDYIEACVQDETGSHTYTAIVSPNIKEENKIAIVVKKQWLAKTGRQPWWIRLTNCDLPNIKGNWLDPHAL